MFLKIQGCLFHMKQNRIVNENLPHLNFNQLKLSSIWLNVKGIRTNCSVDFLVSRKSNHLKSILSLRKKAIVKLSWRHYNTRLRQQLLEWLTTTHNKNTPLIAQHIQTFISKLQNRKRELSNWSVISNLQRSNLRQNRVTYNVSNVLILKKQSKTKIERLNNLRKLQLARLSMKEQSLKKNNGVVLIVAQNQNLLLISSQLYMTGILE